MNKQQKIDQPGNLRKQLSFFISVQNTQGLNFINIAKPQNLQIKLVNNGWTSFQTQKANSGNEKARIIIDFSNAGDISFTAPPERLPGFVLSVDETKKIFVFEQSSPYWNWFVNDSINIVFPLVVANGPNGCGFVAARIENVEGSFNASSTSSLFTLNPEGETSNISASWRYGNKVIMNDTLQGDGAGVLKLTITSDSGIIPTFTSGGKQPSFYIQLSDGYSPGFNALMPPDMAKQIRTEISDTNNWAINEAGDCDYPVWKIAYDPAKGGSAAEVLVKLINIKTPNKDIKNAQCILYFLDIPGRADGYQVLNVTNEKMMLGNSLEDDGGLTIDSFTASVTELNNIDKPTQVLLSWNVSNAGYITLSGMGLVDPKVNDKDVYIEQTTTFVLTAYSASLAKAISQTITVTVKPDLLSRVIPQGTIILWNGNVDTIPANWHLCDGTNGTPDLRDKFVIGAGGSYTPNSSGLANTHTHNITAPPQNFTSSQDGQHHHAMPSNWYARNLSCGVHTGIDTNGGFDPNNTFSQDSGLHSHTVGVAIPQFTSENASVTLLPPWYALCYIMKQGV